MAWDIKIINGHTVIDGFFKNVRYVMMEDIEIWVSLLDVHGKTIHRGVDLVTPNRLDKEATTSFQITLPTVAVNGAKLAFTYKYIGDDGGEGTKWMQSFESNIP